MLTRGAGEKERKKKDYKAAIVLAKHMQGPDRGKLSGKALYGILPAYENNEAVYDVIQKQLKVRPRWIGAFGMHVAECATDKLAELTHAAILASPDLRTTAKRLNPELDVSPMDNPAVKPLEFTLARSATQFETKKTRTTSRTTSRPSSPR